MPDDFGFAQPPFDAAQALLGLKRQLRDLKLSERGNGYEQAGKRLIELSVDNTTIMARIVKRPALAPEWITTSLRSAADVRRFTDTVKQQLSRWSDAD